MNVFGNQTGLWKSKKVKTSVNNLNILLLGILPKTVYIGGRGGGEGERRRVV